MARKGSKGKPTRKDIDSAFKIIGQKLAYLEDLVLVELGSNDPDKEMDYNSDNAQVLVENSNEFDNWLNEVVFDLEHFRSAEQAKAKGQTRAIPKA